jgi:excisionase family DNA binding protein
MGRTGHYLRPTSPDTLTRHARVLSEGGEAPGRARATGACVMTSNSLSEIRFLTVAEVATLMRVSRMTAYRLVHSGELASVRVGRSFRVPERAVHAYLSGAFTEAG